MTDYLALAMAQWEEVSAIMAEELASTVEGTPGGHLFRMEKTPPGPPEKMPGGGRFDSPSPWTPTPTDQGRGAAAPLALEPSPGCPTEGEEARFPHSVAGTGHGGDEPGVSTDPEDLGGPAANEAFGGPWLGSGSRQGQSPTRRGKNLPLPASSQYVTGGLFSTQAWPRGGVIFDGGGSITPIKAGAARGPFFGLSKNGPPGETALPLEGEFSPTPGWGIPSAGDASAQEAVLPLLRQLRQAQWGAGFVQGQRRQLAVTLPETTPAAPALSAEELDLACERDARRYGGGFALY